MRGGSEVPVEFSAIAGVLPARHLVIFMAPEEDFPEATESLAQEAAATTALGLLGDRKPLTERERQVVSWVAQGLQTRDIGTNLFLAPETVKTHVHNAMSKLEARTRAHAVAIALLTGQIAWDS